MGKKWSRGRSIIRNLTTVMLRGSSRSAIISQVDAWGRRVLYTCETELCKAPAKKGRIGNTRYDKGSTERIGRLTKRPM